MITVPALLVQIRAFAGQGREGLYSSWEAARSPSWSESVWLARGIALGCVALRPAPEALAMSPL